MLLGLNHSLEATSEHSGHASQPTEPPAPPPCLSPLSTLTQLTPFPGLCHRTRVRAKVRVEEGRVKEKAEGGEDGCSYTFQRPFPLTKHARRLFRLSPLTTQNMLTAKTFRESLLASIARSGSSHPLCNDQDKVFDGNHRYQYVLCSM